MRSAILVASALALVACSQYGTEFGGRRACPPLKDYDRAFRDALAAEADRLPPGAALRSALADYWAMRAYAAACADP